MILELLKEKESDFYIQKATASIDTHDIRNALTVVIGNIQLIQSDDVIPEDIYADIQESNISIEASLKAIKNKETSSFNILKETQDYLRYLNINKTAVSLDTSLNCSITYYKRVYWCILFNFLLDTFNHAQKLETPDDKVCISLSLSDNYHLQYKDNVSRDNKKQNPDFITFMNTKSNSLSITPEVTFTDKGIIADIHLLQPSD
jgi:hypothetical protein